jgi:ABC-type maltose transport system permease subunit
MFPSATKLPTPAPIPSETTFMNSMILFIPIFILYIFLQDKLMGNISMGGVKE